MALKTVPFNVAFTFSRPDPADYEDINGDTQTAGTDVPRFNYSEGVGEGLLLDASLSETAAINDIPNFNSSSGTWVIKADLDKSKPIPGSGFGEFMEGSGTLVFVYSNGVGKCWADGGVLFTVDPFSPAEPGFLSNGGLAKIQDLTYYPYAWTDEDAAAKSAGAFSTYFTPVKLFSGGEQGAWYDPSDTSTLFQDSAGTIPVTADGDPVGLMLDLSPNGNHASQSVTGSKPIYRTDGTLHWLEGDGVDDYIQTSPITEQPQPTTQLCGVQLITATTGVSIYNGISASSVQYLVNISSQFRLSAGQELVISGSDLSPHVFSALYNGSNSQCRLDGAEAVTGSAGSNGWEGVTFFSNRIFSNNSNHKMYGHIVVCRTLDAAEIDGAEKYLASKSGMSL